MQDSSRKQFLIENITVIVLTEGLIILNYYSQWKNGIIKLAVILPAVVLLFLLLQTLGLWYKPMNKFSKVFSIIQILIVHFILRKSYTDVFYKGLSLIYPVVLLIYITYSNYKYNFIDKKTD